MCIHTGRVCSITTVRTCLIEIDVVCFGPDKYLKMAQNLFPRATPTAPSIPVGPAGPLAGPVRTSGHARCFAPTGAPPCHLILHARCSSRSELGAIGLPIHADCLGAPAGPPTAVTPTSVPAGGRSARPSVPALPQTPRASIRRKKRARRGCRDVNQTA